MRKWEKDGLVFKTWTKELTSEAELVAKKLMKYLMLEMAHLSLKFDNNRFDSFTPPYLYTERRLDSILLPALSKLCNGLVLTEMPVTRVSYDENHQKKKSSGRVDYWCIYKDYTFVIELKQSYDCYRTSDYTRQKTIKPWDVMNEQLKKVKADCEALTEKTKGVIRLGIHILTAYTDLGADEDLIEEFNNNADFIQERLCKDLGDNRRKTKPNAAICWMIPESLILNNQQTFPGLWMIGKVYPLIYHKGSKDYYRE
ncbi:MAG: hypothetical protein IK039_04350 [Bacteroidaceae bacterium]|nr:hypothetical protein [Bacteroidaceae bacterium]